MQFLATFLTLLLLLAPLPGWAYDVLVLQSLREKAYSEAVRGLKRECSAPMRSLILSDYVEADVTRIVRGERPKLIVAVGERALDVAAKVRDIPVLYMMALHPKKRSAAQQTGVGLLIDPARYLSLMDRAGLKRVGVLYDPVHSGIYLKKAQIAARRAGIDLITREVHSPKETPAMLDSLRGKVDAIWMLPDVTAVSAETTEAYFLFSQGELVPVFTFSEVYLPMGGAVALGIDRYDIGRQLGEMAQSILQGTAVSDLPPQFPRKVSVKANHGVLKRLKVATPAPGVTLQ